MQAEPAGVQAEPAGVQAEPADGAPALSAEKGRGDDDDERPFELPTLAGRKAMPMRGAGSRGGK